MLVETAGPRYLIHAGLHLIAKEFCYFQILIVKTVIDHLSDSNIIVYKFVSLQDVALDRVHNLYKYFLSLQVAVFLVNSRSPRFCDTPLIKISCGYPYRQTYG